MRTPGAVRQISVVIPAFKEEGRVGLTVRAARRALEPLGAVEVVVVDDGSTDGTAAEADAAGARVISLRENGGKGAALAAGLYAAEGELLVMLDADLGDSASEAALLVRPVLECRAEMTVATFPARSKRAGMGMVKRLAQWGLRRAGAPPMAAPLSGQRCFTWDTWTRIGDLDPGFGIEMGLNLDAAELGLRVLEVPTQMAHRVTGNDWEGYRHRARQFVAVLRAITTRRRPRPTLTRKDTG